MAIYLKFGNLKGNVTAEGYAGHIALNSVEFETFRQVSMEAGNLSNRESSKPTLSHLTIYKQADSSVAMLWKEALAGSAGQPATISFVRTGSDKVQEFMTYKLTNCIISRYKIIAPKDEEPTERLELSFSAIEVSYKDHDATNKAGNMQRAAYDIRAAKLG